MNHRDIFDGITNIRDDLIDEAERYRFSRPRHMIRWISVTAAVMAIIVVIVCISTPHTVPVTRVPPLTITAPDHLSAFSLVQASYPQMTAYPTISQNHDGWKSDIAAQTRPAEHDDGLERFVVDSVQQFLGSADNSNRLFSPLNAYMGLAMMAELTDGNSRHQILALLNTDSMDALRKQASDIWNSNYRLDGATSSVLAGSVWLNEGLTVSEETLRILADTYFASAFRGDMTSKEFTLAYREWLNEQTGYLLEEQVNNKQLDPNALMRLTTTLLFRSKWKHPFSCDKTQSGVFHAADGDITCDFMHGITNETVHEASKFIAVCEQLEFGEMWLLLPNEDVAVKELLYDTQAQALMTGDSALPQRAIVMEKYIPKWDIVSQMDLKSGLQSLGITHLFDADHANYAALPDNAHAYASSATHDIRITVDENGCSATSYTELPLSPTDKADETKREVFRLDRPFMVIVKGGGDLPLFVGLIRQPSSSL